MVDHGRPVASLPNGLTFICRSSEQVFPQMAQYSAGDLYGSLDDDRRAVVDALIASRTASQSYAVGPQCWLVPFPRFVILPGGPRVDGVPFPMRLLRYRHQLVLGFVDLELPQ